MKNNFLVPQQALSDLVTALQTLTQIIERSGVASAEENERLRYTSKCVDTALDLIRKENNL